LAQRLVEHHGFKLFSGNKTVVKFDESGGLIAVAGTRTMTALDAGLRRFAYKMPEDSYATGPVLIKSIGLIKINEGVEETQKLAPLSALHTLYPYFMDAVNADVIVNGKDVFDGSPITSVKPTLTSNLQRLLQHTPVIKSSGSILYLERNFI